MNEVLDEKVAEKAPDHIFERLGGRKLFLVLYAITMSTVALGLGWVDGLTWGSVLGTIVLGYLGANASVHRGYAARIKDSLSSLVDAQQQHVPSSSSSGVGGQYTGEESGPAPGAG